MMYLLIGGDLASTGVAKQRRAYRGLVTSQIQPELLKCKRRSIRTKARKQRRFRLSLRARNVDYP